MSKFTVDQALQQAVAAHKSGQLQKADRLYTAILRSNPRHPDANHNMGVLAISVGKVDQALPFFKTALNESPGKAQFWISYIDTLTKLGKWSDARTVFDQAKKHGAQGNGFDDLENRLDSIDHVRQSAENVIPETSADQPNSLDALTLEQALRLAQKKETEGSTKESKKIYQDILNKFPKNKKAIAGLKRLVDGVTGDIPKGHGLSKERVQSVIDLYNQGRLNAAVEQGQILIEQYPESWEIWNILGAAAARSNQLEQAIVAFRKVIAIKPDHADAYHNLGIAQQNQGELDEAVETFTQALNINPNQAETYNALGNALQTQGKLDKAIETYNKALNINPDHASAYNNLGNALQKQAKLEQAVEAYNKAITIKADYADAYNNLGTTLHKQAKLDKAIQAYNRAITIQSDHLGAYNNLGNVLQDQGKMNEAVTAYLKAIAINPHYARGHNNLGNVLLKQEKLNEAMDSYNRALVINPNSAEIYNNLGVVLREKGSFTEASEAYYKALEIDPNYAEAYNNLGVSSKLQGNIKEAIGLFKSALEIKSDFADAQNNIGSALLDQGEIKLASEAFMSAKNLDPDHASARNNALSLAIQLPSSTQNQPVLETTTEKQSGLSDESNPRWTVLRAIEAYLFEDFDMARSHIEKFKSIDTNRIVLLEPTSRIFCNAYSQFVGALLVKQTSDQLNLKASEFIYHLGESHCLSYAHKTIEVADRHFKIKPKITFGAKAFHFSKHGNNCFKAITRVNFLSLPKNSNVFISFGEIDCRPREGFITASKKIDTPLENLINQTVTKYVRWFRDLNDDRGHQLYFINLPAPTFDKKLGKELNNKISEVVARFNTELQQRAQHFGFGLIDVFSFTTDKNGHSNGEFHVDHFHLGPDALMNIQRQFLQKI